MSDTTIIRGSGYYGPNFVASGAIPDAFSSASGDPFKIPQQTFLGASIRNFSVNGGFGDTSSVLTVELVNDEFNRSDRTGLGQGADIYHNGINDLFAPPPVGSPVFFTFGRRLENISTAYTQQASSGYFVFGGILQSYVQNRGPGGNPLYSVQVTDPREILSNVTLLLNNYGGSVYNENNIFNIYGFLEYNPSNTTKTQLAALGNSGILTKYVDVNGNISYNNVTILDNSSIPPKTYYVGNDVYYSTNITSPQTVPNPFPITGTGFSRRGQQGIPWYRVRDSLNAMLEYFGALPLEYQNAGFGKKINFRGFNYVIDCGSLPDLPPSYFLDFDEINLLDLMLEICDITSRDLFVSLLPVLSDGPYSRIASYNQNVQNDFSKLIAGVIRIDAIDRSQQPQYGAIKNYIDNLTNGGSGIYVENQDVGYELSNIVTDKFIVGAQEVDLYFFSGNLDRDESEIRSARNARSSSSPNGRQWTLDYALEQQILPYYGVLGKNAVTIPKGFGAYQQILLDTTGLNANGVGNYYVTTEMELRCALVSYDRWVDFLRMYNDIYVESTESNDAIEGSALTASPAIGPNPPVHPISNNYAVSVPRSLFPSYSIKSFGLDGYPYSPCNPPYGYPLYYKRMTKIGIPEGGLTDITSRYTSVLTNFAELKNTDSTNFSAVINAQYNNLLAASEDAPLTKFEQEYLTHLKDLIDKKDIALKDLALIQDSINNNSAMFSVFPKLAKKNAQNAMKVYNFLKNVAEECLGKKFLVKIPNKVNTGYSRFIIEEDGTYKGGPFGFRKRPRTGNMADEFVFPRPAGGNSNPLKEFLLNSPDTSDLAGALKVNYNTILESYEYNYSPVDYGGFFNFDFYQNISMDPAYQPIGVAQALIPQDLTNFINEQSRICPYVRFNHSQYLSFSNFNAEDFSQQVFTASGCIPDLCEFLDNTGDDEFYSFPSENNIDEFQNNRESIQSVAFVKCSLDDKFYHPPRIINSGVDLAGGTVVDRGKKSIPSKIFIPCSGLSADGTTLVEGSGVYVDSFRFYMANYVPTTDVLSATILTFKEGKTAELIDTDLDHLDTNYTYALITLPNRVVPTKDARFRDSIFQSINAEKFKHFMTMDVVKGLSDFNAPAFMKKPDTNLLVSEGGKKTGKFDCTVITAETRLLAQKFGEIANNSITFALPQQMNAIMPSPVYPDLVALPLMSKERSYGPWISSSVDAVAATVKNIGGKIEFIKDENLSPWNYSGYDLMNQAGVLQARFSNSLLLFSERGGFVIPSYPTGSVPSLGQALSSGGPLVTNIQIEVGENGVHTTYKMDLYTSSFGKMQKQKLDMISKISRERQRLRDERNGLIRKGLGKFQTSRNIGAEYDSLRRGDFGSFANQVGSTTNGAMTHVIIESVTNREQKWSSVGASGSRTNPISNIGSAQNISSIGQTAQSFSSQQQLASSHYNTAGASISDIFAPVSNDIFHPNMAHRPPAFNNSHTSLYFDDNSQYKQSDITVET